MYYIFFYSNIDYFGEIMHIIEYTKIVFKSDPCKKCLVRACCRDFCNEKQKWYSYTKDGIYFSRFMIISYWFSVVTLPITIILQFI